MSLENRIKCPKSESVNQGALEHYILGILLIVAPWLFGFAEGGAETWVPFILGLAVIIYSLFTDYEAGAVPLINMTTHLGLDAGAGIFLAISPWILQFAELVWVPHLVLGLLELGSALMAQTTPPRIPKTVGIHRRETGVR